MDFCRSFSCITDSPVHWKLNYCPVYYCAYIFLCLCFYFVFFASVIWFWIYIFLSVYTFISSDFYIFYKVKFQEFFFSWAKYKDKIIRIKMKSLHFYPHLASCCLFKCTTNMLILYLKNEAIYLKFAFCKLHFIYLILKWRMLGLYWKAEREV